MPDIKNEDLLSLHEQIEKAESEQIKLENILNEKSYYLKKNRASKFFFKILSSFLLLSTLILLGYILFNTQNSSLKEQYNFERQKSKLFRSEIDTLKIQLNDLQKNKINLKEIKDLYLYRSLIKKDTVYSVQIQSFSKDNISLISEKFTNTRIYSDSSYYKLSLGIFETLPEAQEFRKIIIRSGVIDKNIFVVSYKDGNRIKIEDPF
ncbi:hypothetical protein GCM10022393_14520 [Aquimarina addita]|uniref:SPOR domain-containing protein n=1 Tax=Aquimarina addita TaxID=870485 RepID=A0ABP7XFX7_9FLAO